MSHAFSRVFVWESIGTRREVKDVLRAAEWLVERWPADHRGSDKHVEAMQACLLELEGKASPEQARARFIEAAREADILVETTS